MRAVARNQGLGPGHRCDGEMRRLRAATLPIRDLFTEGNFRYLMQSFQSQMLDHDLCLRYLLVAGQNCFMGY